MKHQETGKIAPRTHRLPSSASRGRDLHHSLAKEVTKIGKPALAMCFKDRKGAYACKLEY